MNPQSQVEEIFLQDTHTHTPSIAATSASSRRCPFPDTIAANGTSALPLHRHEEPIAEGTLSLLVPLPDGKVRSLRDIFYPERPVTRGGGAQLVYHSALGIHQLPGAQKADRGGGHRVRGV